jgi:hypothetical protein
MGAVECPARGDAIALAHLVVNRKPEVGEEREIEGYRAAGPLVPPVLECIHVIDEVGVIDVGDAAEITA